MLNHIQNKILSKLLTSKKLTFTDARPDGMQNDLYNYHLKYLIKKGYVEKNIKGYSISDLGKKYAHKLNLEGKLESTFKVTVACYLVDYKNNKILLQERKRHPYFGNVETVSGKVRYGERLEEAAKRKLLEETGLSADFQFLGVHRQMRYDKDKKLIEDTLYHICLAKKFTGRLVEENVFGKNFWIEFINASNYLVKNVTYSKNSLEIYNQIFSQDLKNFYIQEELILDRF